MLCSLFCIMASHDDSATQVCCSVSPTFSCSRAMPSMGHQCRLRHSNFSARSRRCGYPLHMQLFFLLNESLLDKLRGDPTTSSVPGSLIFSESCKSRFMRVLKKLICACDTPVGL